MTKIKEIKLNLLRSLNLGFVSNLEIRISDFHILGDIS